MDYLKRNTDISNKVLEDLKKHKDVEGVMFLGGVARGYADVDSDIDIAVFSKKKLTWLSLGENFDADNIDLEFFNIKMEDDNNEWDEACKEAYYEGKIVFDRNGLVKKFIDEKLFYSDEEFQYNYCYHIFHLAWHGFIYTPYRNKNIRGYSWVLPNDLWVRRGPIENGYFVLQKCAGIFMESLFTLNKRWAPDFKWIYRKSLTLPYLPTDYKKKMDFILFSEFNKENYYKKLQYMQEMLDECFEKVSSLLPENMYKLIDEYE